MTAPFLRNQYSYAINLAEASVDTPRGESIVEGLRTKLEQEPSRARVEKLVLSILAAARNTALVEKILPVSNPKVRDVLISALSRRDPNVVRGAVQLLTSGCGNDPGVREGFLGLVERGNQQKRMNPIVGCAAVALQMLAEHNPKSKEIRAFVLDKARDGRFTPLISAALCGLKFFAENAVVRRFLLGVMTSRSWETNGFQDQAIRSLALVADRDEVQRKFESMLCKDPGLNFCNTTNFKSIVEALKHVTRIRPSLQQIVLSIVANPRTFNEVIFPHSFPSVVPNIAAVVARCDQGRPATISIAVRALINRANDLDCHFIRTSDVGLSLPIVMKKLFPGETVSKEVGQSRINGLRECCLGSDFTKPGLQEALDTLVCFVSKNPESTDELSGGPSSKGVFYGFSDPFILASMGDLIEENKAVRELMKKAINGDRREDVRAAAFTAIDRALNGGRLSDKKFRELLPEFPPFSA